MHRLLYSTDRTYYNNCVVLTYLSILVLAASAALAQEPGARLRIEGDIAQPLVLETADLAKMKRATLRASNEGVEVVYEGVWLHDLLVRAGVPHGAELRGKALATYVLVEASDGYQVLFSLAELDPAFAGHQVLLADRADGKALFGMQGSFRLVAQGEKRGARSVRMVSRIHVVQVRK
jgi:DMSO/TMAO reductase YedYZ molybdopterin-dependent catalytic subunit